MNHVLVTGASGFLGVAVRAGCVEVGIEVTGVDIRNAPGVLAADISDADQLDSVLEASPTIDAIVHLAAAGAGDLGLVAGAAANTAAAVHINVEGFVHIAEAAARHGIKRVLWSSSTTIYGPADEYGSSIEESAALRPTTAYGATKAACEHLGPILAKTLGIEIVAVRLPMVYGPGRWYGGSQAPMVALAAALHEGSEIEVEAWGGEADWVHVWDAVTAIISLFDLPTLSPAYHVVGHRGSFAELAQELIHAAVDPSRVRVHVVPDGAPNIPAIDDSLLRKATGWKPRFSDAKSGAADYLNTRGS
jgi:nucleoside-diphosphate-sugar epimerase